MKNFPKKFIEKLNSVTNKRPATVIQHILKHGHITTEELENIYGYKHPPRAVRDVKEQGIPIETYYIKNSEGKRMAAYRFGNPDETENKLSKVAGRTILSKALKRALIDKYGARCFIYWETMDEELLQVDHRIPYEIGGEQKTDNIDCYMLLSPSANRAKSWTCEHCANWKEKDDMFCVNCFWAHPENYTHIAGSIQRQIIITFTGNEIEDYNKLIALVGKEDAQDTIKQLINDYLK
ncbi:MAG: HNH endonuclease [Bacteroidales bacterium]|nr:HNH endonuclease [Bacteroidales bacterium]